MSLQELSAVLERRFDKILPYYRNKHLTKIREVVIPTLKRCETEGRWGKGEARSIKAALNKTDYRNTDAAARGALLCDDLACRGFRHIDVEHGRFERAPAHLENARTVAPHNEFAKAFLDWCEAFAPIAELCASLDAARPVPAYVFAEVSPTVHANVAETMGVDFSSVREPEIEYVERQRDYGDGKPVTVVIAIIHWPAGTRHMVSKFSPGSRAGNLQCEACGHAIKSNNWVPLVADTTAGPVSLWVGRDCAGTMFGAKLAAGETVDWSAARAEYATPIEQLKGAAK